MSVGMGVLGGGWSWEKGQAGVGGREEGENLEGCVGPAEGAGLPPAGSGNPTKTQAQEFSDSDGQSNEDDNNGDIYGAYVGRGGQRTAVKLIFPKAL